MYLDPGSGSVILQVIIASLLGIGVGLRLFWVRIKSLFRKTGDEKATGEPVDEPKS